MAVYNLKSEQDLKEKAYLWAKSFKAGDVYFLYGPMGAGKTTFVRYVAEALGYFEASSPTFVLIQEYDAKIKIFHMDLYRLNTVEDIEHLDLERYFNQEEAIVFVEWSEKLDESYTQNEKKILFSYYQQNRAIETMNFWKN